MFIERTHTHTRTRIHTYIIEIYLDKSKEKRKKKAAEKKSFIVHDDEDYLFVDLYLRKVTMSMNSIDSMELTKVEDLIEHSKMHSSTRENCLNFVIMDAMVRVISDSMIVNDDDDENSLERDE